MGFFEVFPEVELVPFSYVSFAAEVDSHSLTSSSDQAFVFRGDDFFVTLSVSEAV